VHPHDICARCIIVKDVWTFHHTIWPKVTGALEA